MSTLQFPLTTDFDFVGTVEEALDFCQGLEVISSEQHGPAGGNPNVTLKFRNKFEFYGFIYELYDGQEEHVQNAIACREQWQEFRGLEDVEG